MGKSGSNPWPIKYAVSFPPVFYHLSFLSHWLDLCVLSHNLSLWLQLRVRIAQTSSPLHTTLVLAHQYRFLSLKFSNLITCDVLISQELSITSFNATLYCSMQSLYLQYAILPWVYSSSLVICYGSLMDLCLTCPVFRLMWSAWTLLPPFLNVGCLKKNDVSIYKMFSVFYVTFTLLKTIQPIIFKNLFCNCLKFINLYF